MIWSLLTGVVRKDLLRAWSDPAGLLITLCIPLAIGGLMTMATGGSDGPTPKARLLVVDEDDSIVSQFLVGALGRGEGGGVIDAELVEPAVGRSRIDAGEASALLLIPAGFGRALLDETPSELQLLTNPAQRILPGILQETLEMGVDAAFYLQRVVGPQLRTLRDAISSDDAQVAAFPEAEVARLSIEMRRAIQRVESYLFPPAIELSVEAAPTAANEAAPKPSYGLLFFPGVVLMALFFAAQNQSEDLWRERRLGTLRRAMSASALSARSLLFGKVLAGVVVLGGLVAVVLALGAAYHRLPLAVLPAAWLWATVAGGVLLLLMMLVQLHASSQRGAAILSSALVFPLLMVGGSFFAFEAMPSWMASIGRYTPNGWALERLKDILLQRSDAAALAVALGVAGLVGGVLLLVCARAMRRFATR
ncbi:MAG: ABC transporter permease [Planctomycetota bacterium]